MNIQTSRCDGVYPGNSCYIWFPKGGIESISGPKLPDGWSWVEPALYAKGSKWHWQFGWKINVPKNINPGDYKITFTNGAECANVKVLPKFARASIKVPPTANDTVIRQHIESGKIVELLPGIYEFDSPLSIPDGGVIKSAGAVLIRKLGARVEKNHLFAPQGEFTLEGCTITHSPEIGKNDILYIHKWPRDGKHKVTVRNNTIIGGHLGKSTELNMIVENNTFIGAGTGYIANGSVIIGNRFVGPNERAIHPLFIAGTNHALVCSNVWENTSRGIVMQSRDLSNTVVMDSYFHGIHAGEPNAGEYILMESGVDGSVPPTGENGIHDNLFVDMWMLNCAGPAISLYGSGMHHNIFQNVKIEVDATSIAIQALNGGIISENEFHNVQATGCLLLTGNVGKELFNQIHFIEQTQRIGNGDYRLSAQKARVERFPIYMDNVALAGAANIRMVNSSYSSPRGLELINSIHFKPKSYNLLLSTIAEVIDNYIN